MLASYFRLKGNRNFDRVKKKGKLIQQPLYGVCVYNRNDVACPRFGIVISTKISRLATQRNRIKRAMEETIRYNIRHVPSGIDVVFLVKQDIASKSSDIIMRTLEEFLQSSLLKQ
jgi:ribonuclease P protein component